MIDKFYRWCLFFDIAITSAPLDGPSYNLSDLVEPLLRRVQAGQARKDLEGGTRVLRLSQARRLALTEGACLGFVATVGNATAADPSFINDDGIARDADRRTGERRGGSCHCIMRLDPISGHPRRHLMIVEQSPGLGRTVLERLLNSEFAAIAEANRDAFRRESTGNVVKLRPVAHLSTYKSEELDQALRTGSFPNIELIDTTPGATWDEPGEFRPKRRVIEMQLVAPPNDRRNALRRLMDRAREQGYDRMRLHWKAANSTRSVPSEVATDLADINEAAFAKRELIHVQAGLSECSHLLREDFLEAMAAHLQ